MVNVSFILSENFRTEVQIKSLYSRVPIKNY